MNLEEVSGRMAKVLDVLRTDIGTIRTGRITPSLIDNLSLSVYGGSARLKLMELATVTVSDPQTLIITPFDNSIIDEIRKGILEANLGFNPVSDTGFLRITIPPLSQERRLQLIRLMKQKVENGRVMVRQVRHEAMSDVKKQSADKNISEDELFRIEKEVQKITDDTIMQIEDLGRRKEEELMRI